MKLHFNPLKMLPCLGFLALAVCAKNTPIALNEVVTKDKIITIEALELLDKPDRNKYDLKVRVTNLYDKSILLFLGDMQCSKGDVKGMLSHAFFGAGERSIDFMPDQRKEFRFVCVLDRKAEAGEFQLKIGNVFDNPTNDKKTAGKALAKNIIVSVKPPSKPK